MCHMAQQQSILKTAAVLERPQMPPPSPSPPPCFPPRDTTMWSQESKCHAFNQLLGRVEYSRCCIATNSTDFNSSLNSQNMHKGKLHKRAHGCPTHHELIHMKKAKQASDLTTTYWVHHAPKLTHAGQLVINTVYTGQLHGSHICPEQAVWHGGPGTTSGRST